MTEKTTFVIRDAASLREWVRELRNVFQIRSLPLVRFQLTEISEQQNLSISARANRYQRACGCALSGFFMTATVVAMVASYFIAGNHFADIGGEHVFWLVGSTVLATVTGRFFGLLWSRWRLLSLATMTHAMIDRANQSLVT